MKTYILELELEEDKSRCLNCPLWSAYERMSSTTGVENVCAATHYSANQITPLFESCPLKEVL